jgi:hypothetical protein
MLVFMGPFCLMRSSWNLEMLISTEGGKPEEPEKNPRERTNKQLNSHMTPIQGIEPGSQWWEASAHTATCLHEGRVSLALRSSLSVVVFPPGVPKTKELALVLGSPCLHVNRALYSCAWSKFKDFKKSRGIGTCARTNNCVRNKERKIPPSYILHTIQQHYLMPGLWIHYWSIFP